MPPKKKKEEIVMTIELDKPEIVKSVNEKIKDNHIPSRYRKLNNNKEILNGNE
jgi:hypothetical protein